MTLADARGLHGAAIAIDDRRHDARFRMELPAVVLLAFAVRLGALHHPHFYDELYHMLAAESLLADGTLAIAGGEPYTRARGFTYLVAGVFEVAGIGMTQLRLVSLAAGTLTVALLFGWLRRATNRTAAWIAAMLLVFDPESVLYSTTGRFYALHALLFLSAVVGVWWATPPQRSTKARIGAMTGAAATLAAAIHLQVATVLGAALLVFWAALAFALEPFTHAPVERRRRWLVLALVALAVVAIAAWGTGLASWVFRMSAFAPAWAAEEGHELRFYYWAWLFDYPLLVALLPMLAVLALGRWPREASLCLLLVATVLAYHSLAVFKETRFVLYVYPLWFAASAMGAAVLAHFVRDRTVELSDRLMPALSVATRRRVGAGALGAMLLFALLATPGFVRTRRIVEGADTDPWATQSGELRRMAAEHDVVLGAAKLPVLYFMGRLDAVLERPDAGNPDRELDGWDRQVGRPVVATVAAFQGVVARHPRGLVVADSTRWRKRWAVRDTLADYIERTLERVPLRDPRIIVYRWARPPLTALGTPVTAAAHDSDRALR